MWCWLTHSNRFFSYPSQKQIKISCGPPARNFFCVPFYLKLRFRYLFWLGQGPRMSDYLVFCYQPWYLSNWSYDDVPSSFSHCSSAANSVLIIWLMFFRSAAHNKHTITMGWLGCWQTHPFNQLAPFFKSLCPRPSFLLHPF